MKNVIGLDQALIDFAYYTNCNDKKNCSIQAGVTKCGNVYVKHGIDTVFVCPVSLIPETALSKKDHKKIIDSRKFWCLSSDERHAINVSNILKSFN